MVEIYFDLGFHYFYKEKKIKSISGKSNTFLNVTFDRELPFVVALLCLSLAQNLHSV